PAGMVVDPATGVVAWTPTADEVGPENAVLRVRDARGDVVLQDLSITVFPADTGLFITSTPSSFANPGLPYQYAVRAVDALSLPLSFRLDTVPAGMTIDPHTGLIQWTPAAGQMGTNPVTVIVTDSQGLTATQPFNLQVVPTTGNQSPTISS